MICNPSGPWTVRLENDVWLLVARDGQTVATCPSRALAEQIEEIVHRAETLADASDELRERADEVSDVLTERVRFLDQILEEVEAAKLAGYEYVADDAKEDDPTLQAAKLVEQVVGGLAQSLLKHADAVEPVIEAFDVASRANNEATDAVREVLP